MSKRTNKHHVEIAYGTRHRDRKVIIDGHDITRMVPPDGVTVQFTERGPVVYLDLTLRAAGSLDITLDGAKIEIEDDEIEDGPADG